VTAKKAPPPARRKSAPVDGLTPKRGVLDPAAVAAKLRELNGNQAAVGRAFGVTRQAVSKFVAARPDLAEVARECRETMTDNAESALYRAVLAGEPWAVCFYLKTQAKARGYVERVQVEAEETVRVELAEEIVDAPDGPAGDPAAPGAG
jgi:predicted transcriptional regulator